MCCPRWSRYAWWSVGGEVRWEMMGSEGYWWRGCWCCRKVHRRTILCRVGGGTSGWRSGINIKRVSVGSKMILILDMREREREMTMTYEDERQSKIQINSLTKSCIPGCDRSARWDPSLWLDWHSLDGAYPEMHLAECTHRHWWFTQPFLFLQHR